MRRVGIIATASSAAPATDRAPTEMVYPLVKQVVAAAGLPRARIDYTVAGSSDFLEGRPFSFGFALDLAGAVPPIEESHVEGDGAWAAYDAWVRIQAGLADTALVVAWGKSSEGSLSKVLNTTLDPVWEAPLGVDHVALAALAASATGYADEQMAAVVAAARGISVTAAIDSPFVVEPLRRSYLPPVTDGAAAVVLAVEEAVPPGAHVTWIDGVAHATDGSSPGARALNEAPSAVTAFEKAAALAGWRDPEVAMLHACFPHQSLLLRDVFDLACPVDPDGGALRSNPIMATGLERLAAAARACLAGSGRALAHATQGHNLQANMVWLVSS